jgi:hypothetical protein
MLGDDLGAHGLTRAQVRIDDLAQHLGGAGPQRDGCGGAEVGRLGRAERVSLHGGRH